MLLKKIFIMFISLSQFLNYAKAQGIKTNELEGIIIYYDNNSIPEEIFLLSCEIKYPGSFNDFVIATLKKDSIGVIDLYFQGMRRGMPQLDSVMQQVNFIKAERIIGEKVFPMKISAGKIILRNTYPKEDPDYKENRTKFTVKVESQSFDLFSIDHNLDKNGLPVFFELLFLK